MTQITPRQAKDMDKSFEEEEEFYIDVIEGADNINELLDDMNSEGNDGE